MSSRGKSFHSRSEIIESLLNDGNDTFSVGQSLAESSQAVAALADLSGDQKLDLVAAADLVSVFDGNGNGTFGPEVSSYSVTTSTNNLSGLLALDFNGDGKPDLASGIVVNPGLSTNFEIGLLSNEGTSFSPATIDQVATDVGFQTNAWEAAGDFNGDGRMDLAVSGGNNENSSPGVYIQLGNGNGTFQAATLYGAGVRGPIAIGDFNNDGIPDVVGILATSQGLSLAVLLGNGDGTFGFPVSTGAGGGGPESYLSVADFNGDGNLDVVIIDADTAGLFYGNGDGTFTTGPSYTVLLPEGHGGDANGLAVGDLTGSGILDLVWGIVDVVSNLPYLVVMLGNGDGTFQTPLTTVSDTGTAPLAIADFNLDGKPDFVAAGLGNDISFSMGNGDGTFQPAEHFYVANPAYALTLADFDGNGSPDVAVASSTNISVLYNSLSGPAAVPSPGAVAFGNEGLGYTSPVHIFTLTNSSSTALSITGISITGAQAGDYSQTNTCGSSLATGSNCAISVTFAPQASGMRTAAIQIADNAWNTPQTIRLTGTGATPSVAATVTPGTLAFGSQYLGSTGSPQTVTLSSTGSIPLAVSSISLTGGQAGDFSQTNNCGNSLGNGFSCQVTVSFSPTTTGSRSAVLSVRDNAGNSPQAVGLSGTGANRTIGLSAGSSPTTATVTAGQTASYTLSIGGTGLSGTATLACTGAPKGAECSVPSSAAISATTPSTVKVSVTTTSSSAASTNYRGLIPFGGMWATVIVGIILVPKGRGKRDSKKRYLGVVVGSLILICSCGGSSTPAGSTTNPNGTPTGNYTLTVSATLNSVTESTTLTLKVQ